MSSNNSSTPDDRWFLDSIPTDRFPAWTRGNAADVFPTPFSPLAYDLVLRGGMSCGLRDGYIQIGALDYDEYDNPYRPDLFHVFGGYPYNPLSMTRIFGARMPGVTPELIDKAFLDDRADVPPYEEQPWHTSAANEARLTATMGWVLSTETVPQLDDDRALAATLRATRPNLATVTDATLIARARSLVPYVQLAFEGAMYVSTLSSIGPGVLGAVCEALGDATMAVRLLAGIEVDSGAPARAMWELGRVAASSPEVTSAFEQGPDAVLDALRASGSPAANDFLAKFDQFLYEFGSRAQGEYDLIAQAWEVKPRIALAAIDLMRRSDESLSPANRNAASVAERDRLLVDIRAKLAGDPESAGMFEAGLRSSQLFMAGRERAKTSVVRIIHEMRMALREFGRRLVERGVIDEIEQLFMLNDDEIDRLRHHPEIGAAPIPERWATYQRLCTLDPVFVVNGTRPTISDMTPKGIVVDGAVQVGSVLTGAAGSGGTATGRARVILDASDPMALEPGDVMIAPQTDPSWVPLFVSASAVVVNVGALGSHAMIVSRELGIPCVASVADATALIPDGAIVTVDGTTGTVTIVSLP